jgi:hypothetical protein
MPEIEVVFCRHAESRITVFAPGYKSPAYRVSGATTSTWAE